MPEHQQIQQSKKMNTIFQKQTTPVSQTPVSNSYSIIQRAKINPKSLTHADVMQLQRTIGNRAVGRLLSSIGNTSVAQQATVQRQEIQEEGEPLQGKMTETVQRQEIPEEEEPLQGKMAEVIQREEIPEEEEPLQGKMIGTIQRQEIPEEEEPLQTKRENNTGMPDNLKAGVESQSSIDMSDVRVHYNSSKPAEMGALAYTQGTNIHVALGQEKHLPHEAWHVVQQKQGRVKPTMQMKNGKQINDDMGLEHEADVMGTAALNQKVSSNILLRDTCKTSSSLMSRRLLTQVAQRKKYEELDDFNKARVDSLADNEYETQAGKFEERIGWKLSEAPQAVDAVNKMLDAVKKIVDAWAKKTGQEKLSVYQQEFQFDEGDKYFGAFKMTGEAIKKVFDSRNLFGKAQPTRKKLKVIYNAVRNNNLAKWLKVAADDMHQATLAVRTPITVWRAQGAFRNGNGFNFAGGVSETVQPGFAVKSGLSSGVLSDPVKRAALLAASDREKLPLRFGGPGAPIIPTHIAAPDWWSGLARGTQDEASRIDRANKDRLYGQNRDVPLAEQHTVRIGDVKDLTADEIRLIKERIPGSLPMAPIPKKEKKRFKANADDKITWEQGREAIIVMFNSEVEKTADAIGARLEAGISGSTNMMFVAAKNLGLDSPPMLQKLRLAMLGWMLPNHDHSYYEIMTAAQIQGVPFYIVPNQKGYQYEAPGNYIPMSVNDFRNVLDRHVFPRFFLSSTYKDELAAKLPSFKKEPSKRAVEGMGLPAAIVDQLSDRALVELRALQKHIQDTKFEDPIGDPDAQKKARAINRLLARHIREGVSFRYLVHKYPAHAEVWFVQMLSHAHKPLTDDQDMLLRIDQEDQLPAPAANVETRRAALVTAGIPRDNVARFPEHIINDLIQINAVIANLPLDKNQPLQSPANKTHYDKLMAMQQADRIFNVIGRPLAYWTLSKLLAHVHGEVISRSILNTPEILPELSAEGQRLKQQGIPDLIVRKIVINPPLINLVDNLSAEINKIAGLLQANQMAELKMLSVTHAELKGIIDNLVGSNWFDMIVAAVAANKGINLSTDVHFKTLERTSRALNTANPINIDPKERAGFSEGAFFDPLVIAKTQLDENLKKEGATLAGTRFENLTPVEIASINQYTKLGGMGAWQEVLRNPDTADTKSTEKLVKLAPKIEAAVSGLRKLPVATGPVYSAARMDLAGNLVEALRQHQPGQIINQDNFLSSARSIGASFIRKPDYGVAYVIDDIKTGHDINVLSTNYGEEEVLFPPGAKFIVTKVEDKSASLDGYNKVWVSMSEI